MVCSIRGLTYVIDIYFLLKYTLLSFVFKFHFLFFRSCAQFDVFTSPLPPNSSSLARTLHSALAHSTYHISQAERACVFSAVLDAPDQLQHVPFRTEHADKFIIFLLNGQLPVDHGYGHVFSQHSRGLSGIFMEVPSTFNVYSQVDLNFYKTTVS